MVTVTVFGLLTMLDMAIPGSSFMIPQYYVDPIPADQDWLPFHHVTYFRTDITTAAVQDPLESLSEDMLAVEVCHFLGTGISASISRVERYDGVFSPWQLYRFGCGETSTALSSSLTLDLAPGERETRDRLSQAQYDGCRSLLHQVNAPESPVRLRVVHSCFPELARAHNMMPVVQRPTLTYAHKEGGIYVLKADWMMERASNERVTNRDITAGISLEANGVKVVLFCFNKFHKVFKIQTLSNRSDIANEFIGEHYLDITLLCAFLPDLEVEVTEGRDQSCTVTSRVERALFELKVVVRNPPVTGATAWRWDELSCGTLPGIPQNDPSITAIYSKLIRDFDVRFAEAHAAFPGISILPSSFEAVPVHGGCMALLPAIAGRFTFNQLCGIDTLQGRSRRIFGTASGRASLQSQSPSAPPSVSLNPGAHFMMFTDEMVHHLRHSIRTKRAQPEGTIPFPDSQFSRIRQTRIPDCWFEQLVGMEPSYGPWPFLTVIQPWTLPGFFLRPISDLQTVEGPDPRSEAPSRKRKATQEASKGKRNAMV